MNATIKDRNDEVTNKLDSLSNRISDLQSHFENEKRSIMRQIDERGEELAALLNKFRVLALEYVTEIFM